MYISNQVKQILVISAASALLKSTLHTIIFIDQGVYARCEVEAVFIYFIFLEDVAEIMSLPPMNAFNEVCLCTNRPGQYTGCYYVFKSCGTERPGLSLLLIWKKWDFVSVAFVSVLYNKRTNAHNFTSEQLF